MAQSWRSAPHNKLKVRRPVWSPVSWHIITVSAKYWYLTAELNINAFSILIWAFVNLFIVVLTYHRHYRYHPRPSQRSTRVPYPPPCFHHPSFTPTVNPVSQIPQYSPLTSQMHMRHPAFLLRLLRSLIPLGILILVLRRAPFRQLPARIDIAVLLEAFALRHEAAHVGAA